MVLEAMVSPKKAERNPPFIILLGFLFVTVSVWLTAAVLDIEPKSMLMIMFVVIPALPFTLALFQSDEEQLEQEKVLGSRTLAKHFSTLTVLLALFLGLIIGFAFWYLALPADQSEKVFSLQLNELRGIKAIGVTLGGKILAAFDRARVALGQMGVAADTNVYQSARDEIVRTVKETYTFFREER